MCDEIVRSIKELKEAKDAVILAHYYVDGKVQEIADYVGDSYYLAELATRVLLFSAAFPLWERALKF